MHLLKTGQRRPLLHRPSSRSANSPTIIKRQTIRRPFLLLLVFLCFAAQSCGRAGQDEPAEDVNLHVFAPSSVIGPMQQAIEAYEAENAHVHILANYASLPLLEEQLRAKAPADVFICDIQEKTDELVKEGFLTADNSPVLCTNSIVLYVPKGNPEEIGSFEGLLEDSIGTVSIGDPEKQASGYYCMQALYYMNLDKKLEAAGKLNIMADAASAARSVENGDAAAGIGFYTDIYDSDLLEVAAVASENTYQALRYTANVVKYSSHLQEANAFAAFLAEDKALAFFYTYGYKRLD